MGSLGVPAGRLARGWLMSGANMSSTRVSGKGFQAVWFLLDAVPDFTRELLAQAFAAPSDPCQAGP